MHGSMCTRNKCSFFTLFSLHGQVCSADCKFAQETRNYLGKMGQTSGAKYQGRDPAYDRPPARAHASFPPSATSWRWGWKRGPPSTARTPASRRPPATSWRWGWMRGPPSTPPHPRTGWPECPPYARGLPTRGNQRWSSCDPDDGSANRLGDGKPAGSHTVVYFIPGQS